MIRIHTIPYHNWPHCIELENGYIRLVVTTDAGPRIIYCGAAGSDFNLFHEFPEQQGKTGSAEWMSYGGHRLWHSPQEGYRPNQPDNDPVPYEIKDNALILNCPEEKATKVQKEIRISLLQGEPLVRVRHRIYNRGLWPVKLAAWALSVMRAGGTEILPVPQEDTWFMPNYAICCWPWTRLNDRRFSFGEQYMILRHDPAEERWFKIGYRNTEGWGAYLAGGFMFLKIAFPIKGKEYPDYGSTFETFADNNFVELETLGPLSLLEPGGYTEHTEDWHVFKDIPLPSTEAEIGEQVTRRIRGIISGGKSS
jgi:hypothetical protein